MKIDVVNFIISQKTEIKKNIYFITGNERTLMDAVKDKVVNDYKSKNNIAVEKIKNLSLFKNDIGLFEEKKIYIINEPVSLEEKDLDRIGDFEDIFIFFYENSPKTNFLKKLLKNHKGSLLFECYELSKDDKVRILNNWVKTTSTNLSDDVYWALIDLLDNRFAFLNKELDKLDKLKIKIIDIDVINKIISKNNIMGEKIFFEILQKNEKIIKLYNEKIINKKDVTDLYYFFKQFCLLIICNQDEGDFVNAIPKYLFKEKRFLIGLFSRYNNEKKKTLLTLIQKTERVIRESEGVSLMIGLRFILSFKKLTIS